MNAANVVFGTITKLFQLPGQYPGFTYNEIKYETK
jgi:hypothetical protein